MFVTWMKRLSDKAGEAVGGHLLEAAAVQGKGETGTRFITFRIASWAGAGGLCGRLVKLGEVAALCL